MSDIPIMMLTLVAVALWASAAGMMGLGLGNVFGPFFLEVRDESAGGIRGTGSVVVRKLGVLNRNFMWAGYEYKIRRRLVRAGEPQDYRPEDVMALQEIGLLAGLSLGIGFTLALQYNLAWSLVFAVVGLFYPLIWVNDQVKKRHLQISRALPFNLDLLTLSVEAGLDFTGALAKVVEKGRPGPLRDELALVLRQLKMGKTREEALKSMIARVDLPALSQFVMALIQADKMGTSLGKILRIQSTQLRIERTQRAEKLANEAPVKMLFPLIGCIFPTVFMVLFGPIIFAAKYGNIAG